MMCMFDVWSMASSKASPFAIVFPKYTNRMMRIQRTMGPVPLAIEDAENRSSFNQDYSMCFPATAALEKLMGSLSPQDCQDSKRKQNVGQPPSRPHTFNMHHPARVSNGANSENDDDSEEPSPPSPLGFPLIEWSSVAVKTEHVPFTSPSCPLMSLMDSSKSSIQSKEEANSFLDRFLAGETNSSPTPSHLEHSTTTTATSSVHISNESTNKHGGLVRSIALGSRLALLDSPIDIISDKHFCHSMTSTRRRSATCTFG
jgi:hypothetical protein